MFTTRRAWATDGDGTVNNVVVVVVGGRVAGRDIVTYHYFTCVFYEIVVDQGRRGGENNKKYRTITTRVSKYGCTTTTVENVLRKNGGPCSCYTRTRVYKGVRGGGGPPPPPPPSRDQAAFVRATCYNGTR